LFFVVLILGFNAIGQTNSDSLLAIWEDESQSDSIRISCFEDYILNDIIYSHPDSAIRLADQLFNFSRERNNHRGLGISYYLKGKAFYIIGVEALALDFFQQSLKLNEEIENSEGVANCLNSLGLIYHYQGNMERALEYFNDCARIREDIQDLEGMANVLLNMGTAYHAKGDSANGMDYWNQSLRLSTEIDDKAGMARSLGNIGISHERANKEKSLYYYSRSLKLFEELGNDLGILNNLLNIGRLHRIHKDYTKALEFCIEAVELAKDRNILPEQREGCECLYSTYKELGKEGLALQYLEKISELNLVLSAKETSKLLLQMEFTNERVADSLKQVENDLIMKMAHEAEIRRKDNTRNITIAVTFLFLLLIWGLYGRWKKAIAEKNLTEEKIDRVLQFEQLRKLDSIMEGQEMERKRITEDIHDKLGGKFTALSFIWSSIYKKELKSGTAKDDELKALDGIIQSLSQEIRQVARENGRTTSGDFELIGALEELRFLVESSHQMEFNLLINGLDSMDRKVELELYKVILELVGNALKYSKAKHINLHLNKVNGHLVLIAEDDGIGFKMSDIKSGMGLRNIKSRAERLGGVVEIDSKPGRGTTVIMELDA
jgi:signal transduction histidine kinase